MKSNLKPPPFIALKLLQWLLPESVKDDIFGDLNEEFYHSNRSVTSNKIWFWQQTITTCTRYNMNKKTAVSFALATLSISIFYVMLVAIAYLAYGEDGGVYNNGYWTSGAVHLFFIEPVFWQTLSGTILSNITLGLFINIPSIIWTGFSLILVKQLNTRYKLDMKTYGVIMLSLISLPYLWGIAYFKLNVVPLRESGPIIAFMWMSILYLILPLGYSLMTKIQSQTSAQNI